MGKIVVGVVAGMLGGAALGVFVLAPQPPAASLSVAASDSSDTGQAQIDQLQSQLIRAQSEVEKLKQIPAKLESDNEHMQVELHALRRKVEDLQAEGKRARSSDLLENPIQQGPTSEEIKASAQLHMATLKTAFEARNKRGALAALRELRQLGPHAHQEFFEAWMLISDGGKAGSRRSGGKNPLELSWVEASTLINDEMRDVALANIGGEIPIEAQKAALGRLVFDDEMLTSEKVAKVGEVMAQTSEPLLVEQAIETLDWLNGPESSKYLSQAAGNSNISTELRLEAIDAMGEEPQFIDISVVDQLERDADPKVAIAGKRLRMIIAPPISGLLVTELTDNGQIEQAGVQVGDIMLSYNGQKLSDMRSLGPAKQTADSNTPVVIEVYRNGATLSFLIEAGFVGIRDGVGVEVKN